MAYIKGEESPALDLQPPTTGRITKGTQVSADLTPDPSPANSIDDNEWMQEHLNDPNLYLTPGKRPISTWSGLTSESTDPTKEAQQIDSDDIEYESPYPEVRAAVANVDDPSMPVNTFRMWFLGLFFTIGIILFNSIFAMRYPGTFISSTIIQLVSLPCGKALAYILPTTVINIFGHKFSLNPGPFSIKEHVCLTVMAHIAHYLVYVSEATLALRIYYGAEVPYSFHILIALGCQTLGIGLGGLMRSLVVYPASMIWPNALVDCALYNALHNMKYGSDSDSDSGGYTMSRLRFFGWACFGSFLWYWVPGYLFVGLGMFNWVCWIVPDNVTVNTLFGVNSGLGMSALTFDWAMVTYLMDSPLVTPWWSQMNTIVGFVLFFWILAPILYFTNVWNSAYMPILSYLAYDNTGSVYQVTNILTNGVFDPEKYKAYSPVFHSCAHALAYGTAFAATPALLVHTILWFRKDIARRWRNSLLDERDAHSRLMRHYTEVPSWWYFTTVAVALAFLLIATETHKTLSQLPAWAVLLGCAYGAILALPIAMIYAVTNHLSPSQVLAQLIIGYILPGRPAANMLFKSIGFSSVSQSVFYANDLKIGHYMKIPPRTMFAVRAVSALVTCLVATGTQEWMIANIPDFCTPAQEDGFRCVGSNTFFTASVLWGSIGPAKLYSPGKPYAALLWFFPLGALLPIPFYLLARRFPRAVWRYVNIPIVFVGMRGVPMGNGVSYASWAIVGFVFNFVVRRYRVRWWMRYNYVLSAGLDAGVVIGMFVVFFCLFVPKGGITLDWWGNRVWYMNADGEARPLKALAEGETFGPASWQ